MSLYDTIDLRIEQYAAQQHISREALAVSVDADNILGMVAIRLVRKVATLPSQETVRAPLTWWDALKEAEQRRSPIVRWWVRRHPVVYRTWRAFEMLPAFPVLDKYRHDVRLFGWTES